MIAPHRDIFSKIVSLFAMLSFEHWPHWSYRLKSRMTCSMLEFDCLMLGLLFFVFCFFAMFVFGYWFILQPFFLIDLCMLNSKLTSFRCVSFSSYVILLFHLIPWLDSSLPNSIQLVESSNCITKYTWFGLGFLLAAGIFSFCRGVYHQGCQSLAT